MLPIHLRKFLSWGFSLLEAASTELKALILEHFYQDLLPPRCGYFFTSHHRSLASFCTTQSIGRLKLSPRSYRVRLWLAHLECENIKVHVLVLMCFFLCFITFTLHLKGLDSPHWFASSLSCRPSLWIKQCITLVSLSVRCVTVSPLCVWALLCLLDVHCCFALWIRPSSLWIYLLFPGLIPVLWPLPALTPPKPTFLFSKVFLLTPTPLLPGVYVQFFFHQFFFHSHLQNQSIGL